MLLPATPRDVTAQRIIAPALSTELCLATPAARTMTPLQAAAAELARTTFSDLAIQEPPAWIWNGSAEAVRRNAQRRSE